MRRTWGTVQRRTQGVHESKWTLAFWIKVMRFDTKTKGEATGVIGRQFCNDFNVTWNVLGR